VEPTDDQGEVESDLPEGVPTAPPERPSPDEETLQSAEAFGQYVLEVWWYTVTSGDASTLEQLAALPLVSSEYRCEFCEGAIESAEGLLADGVAYRPKGRGIRFRDPQSDASAAVDGEYLVRWDWRHDGVAKVRLGDGDVLEEQAGPPEWTTTLITMRWKDDSWQLLSYNWSLEPQEVG
jgi:hypothetical protein